MVHSGDGAGETAIAGWNAGYSLDGMRPSSIAALAVLKDCTHWQHQRIGNKLFLVRCYIVIL